MDATITATGTEHWEILSDDLTQAFEEMADRTAAHWEEIVDGLAQDEIPPPPASPWISLEAALIESQRTVDAARWISVGSTLQTVRLAARAS